jgi:hypothetical protein
MAADALQWLERWLLEQPAPGVHTVVSCRSCAF